MKFNWGTRLEALSNVLIYTLKLNLGDDYAYQTAREIMRQFMRVNPNFWEETSENQG